jgi:1,4-alpha-glucan branching enzyme
LEAIEFLKELNVAVYEHFPDVQTIAEESTSWPGVSKPVFGGGLGFGMKWMMGWMNDTLKYFQEDPINRKYHHGQITFSTVYAFTENFMLPLSHDEVVHGKKSLLNKMPGDEWQKFANLRLLFTYMFTHTGTKLLFMGNEFAQNEEWNVQHSLQWHLLQHPPHVGAKALVKELNNLYKTEPALYEKNFSNSGFEWLDVGDSANSTLVYIRKGNDEKEQLVVILNMTPVPRNNYRLGVPVEGTWKLIFNSDQHRFYGSSFSMQQELMSEPISWMNKNQSIAVNLPPLAGVILKLA